MSDDFTPSSRLAEDIARIEAAVQHRHDTDTYRDPVDFRAILACGGVVEPPRPDLLRRDDGVGLFPRGRWTDDTYDRHTEGSVSNLWGDRESGKTMTAEAAMVQTMIEIGRHNDLEGVLFIDADHNGAESVAARLLMLGLPRELLDWPTLEVWPVRSAVDVLEASRSFAKSYRCGLAVVDATDEVMAMFGADPNKGDDYSTVMHAVTDPLVAAGHGVVLIDHTARTSDGRGPSGSVVKQRLITGTSIEVRPVRQFVPGQGGAAELWVVKDRNGGLRRECPDPGQPRQLAGTFVLDPPGQDGIAPWRVEAPWPAQQTPAGATDWRAAASAMAGPFGVDQLAAAVTGATTRSHQEMARRAIKELVRSGALKVAHEGGGRGNPTLWEAS